MRDTVSFDQCWTRFDAGGQPVDPDGPTGAAKVLLDQLGWWSAVLRDARRADPYRVGG